jgi:hypothetical protein
MSGQTDGHRVDSKEEDGTGGLCRVKVPRSPPTLLVLNVCPGQERHPVNRISPFVTAVVRWAMSQ